jgi:hypothetical protein
MFHTQLKKFISFNKIQLKPITARFSIENAHKIHRFPVSMFGSLMNPMKPHQIVGTHAKPCPQTKTGSSTFVMGN